MKSFFKEDALIITESTTAIDVDAWDSLNHMQFISAVEKQFQIEFDFFEIMDLENVGELVNAISNKLKQ